MRRGELKTDQVAGCPGLKIPAQVVFYQARAGATGSDHLVYEVTTSTGEVGTYEDSGLVVEKHIAGEEFFDAEGAVSLALKPAVELLMQLHRSRQATDLAVSALAQAGVIRPWQINVKSGQGEQAISGLHHVDEAALGALSNDEFLKLRTALPIAYAQMLSMGQIGIFEHLARLHSQPGPAPVAALPESLDSLLERFGDDIIRFN
jgi:hypothetical protein